MDNNYFDILHEDYINYQRSIIIEELEWDLLTEEEQKQGIFDRIKSMINSIMEWLKNTWDKFVSKFKKDPKVTKADGKIKRLWNKIKGIFSKTNKNNANENYNDIKDGVSEIRDTANNVINSVKNNNLEKAPESAHLTPSFYKAVEDGNIQRVRIMMKNSLLVDPSFHQFDWMDRIAGAKMKNLYDKHDNNGRLAIDNDTKNWNDDYMDRQMVLLMRNFSHERIAHLKRVVKHSGRK